MGSRSDAQACAQRYLAATERERVDYLTEASGHDEAGRRGRRKVWDFAAGALGLQHPAAAPGAAPSCGVEFPSP